MSVSPDVLVPGFSVAGVRQRWDIIGELGKGGTSRVLSVIGDDGAQGALKLLSGHRFAVDAALERRHDREVEEMAALSHRNVLPVLDIVALGAGRAAVFESATSSLDAYLKSTTRLDTVRAIALLQEIASGLGAIHAAGLVHRDLSPKNVLLMEDGRMCVSDLGAGHRPDYETVTRQDDHLGSLLFVSPQQASDPHLATAADDVFSLGQLAYVVLTGQRPQGNPPPLVIMRPELPARVISSVELMRAHDRAQRPPDGMSASELLGMSSENWLETAIRLVEHRSFAEALAAASESLTDDGEENSAIVALNRALTQADQGWHPSDPTQYLRFALWLDAHYPSKDTASIRRLAESYWESEIAEVETTDRSWARGGDSRGPLFTDGGQPLLSVTWGSAAALKQVLRVFLSIVERVHHICLLQKLRPAASAEEDHLGLALLGDPFVRAVLVCIEPLLVFSWAGDSENFDENVASLPSQWLRPFDWLDEALIVMSLRRGNKRTFLRMLDLDPSGQAIRARWKLHIDSSCHCDVIDTDFDSRGLFVPQARDNPNCTYLKLVSAVTSVAEPMQWERLWQRHSELQTIAYASDAVPVAVRLLQDRSK